jgi:hypothetical protein
MHRINTNLVVNGSLHPAANNERRGQDNAMFVSKQQNCRMLNPQ